MQMSLGVITTRLLAFYLCNIVFEAKYIFLINLNRAAMFMHVKNVLCDIIYLYNVK